jgi:hypothetical protein
MEIINDSPIDKKNQAKVYGTIESIRTASKFCVPQIRKKIKEGLPIFNNMKKNFDLSPKNLKRAQQEIAEIRNFLLSLSGELTYATLNDCPASSFILEETQSLLSIINHQEEIFMYHVKIKEIEKKFEILGVH